MLIKYNSQASFTAASGIIFEQGDVLEVAQDMGETLIDTFIGMFEDVTPKATQPAKAETKPKAKAE